MANRLRLLLIACVLALAAVPAHATLYSYTPPDADIDDLDHYSYYTWGIRDQALADELSNGYVITGAKLTIKNIWNWEPEPNNLYINLLDNPRTGIREWTDNQGGGNAFNGQGPLIANWTDPNGLESMKQTISFDLGTLGLLDDLMAFILNPPSSWNRGHFGFGFDPDCHYFNTGVNFCLTTAPEEEDEPVVPEPATLALVGLGLSGAGLLRRKRANAP